MSRYSVGYYVGEDTPTWEISRLHHKTTTGSINQVSDYISNNKMLHMFLESENELQALETAMHEFKKISSKTMEKGFGADMKFTLEYIPKVTWEPDTDKWRLFLVDEHEEDSAGLNIVTEWVIDDDMTYVVDYEADSITDGFNKGYELIMEYVGETENDIR